MQPVQKILLHLLGTYSRYGVCRPLSRGKYLMGGNLIIIQWDFISESLFTAKGIIQKCQSDMWSRQEYTELWFVGLPYQLLRYILLRI